MLLTVISHRQLAMLKREVEKIDPRPVKRTEKRLK